MEKYDFGKFDNDVLCMWYKGTISDDVTNNLIELAEADTEKSGLGKAKKKVSFLMAESFQNIVRHGLVDEVRNRIQGSFGLTNRYGEIHIFSANHITTEQAAEIEEKLSSVNELTQEELKTNYRRILSEGEFSGKGGAGLGLIEMARKSDKPLQYKMRPAGNRVEFCMQIDRLIAGEHTDTNMGIDEGVTIHEYLDAHNILLLFKGDFDRETTGNIVEMFSENADLENSKMVGRAIFHSGVELVQNMSRHGLNTAGKTEGVFVMAVHNNEVIITTKNFIDPVKKNDFEQHLITINSKSKEQLTEWYKARFRETMEEDSTENAGLGLIEIAKRIDGAINYSFQSSPTGIEAILQVRVKLD